jgi:hypothetical protein
MIKNFDLMSGSYKEIMDTTNNSSVFRRARKRWLEVGAGLIRCSYCRYHRGENRREYYGGFLKEDETIENAEIKFPSWKLASKNRKQWMPKNNVKMNIIPLKNRRDNEDYVEFTIEKSSGIKYSKK